MNKPEGFDAFDTDVKNYLLKIKDVQTKGKFIYFTLDHDWYIWNTLGMSGTWTTKFSKKHVALTIHTMKKADDDGCFTVPIGFIDSRHFGTVKFVKGQKPTEDKLKTLGYDPFDGLPPLNIFDALKRKKWAEKPIAQVMMDQTLFAGVGNYIRAEALYAAKISPWRLSKDLSLQEVVVLTKHITTIMVNSYNSNGATIATYRDANGNSGTFSSRFACYGRKVDPNGNPIITEETADKRTIHWCPNVQT